MQLKVRSIFWVEVKCFVASVSHGWMVLLKMMIVASFQRWFQRTHVCDRVDAISIHCKMLRHDCTNFLILIRAVSIPLFIEIAKLYFLSSNFIWKTFKCTFSLLICLSPQFSEERPPPAQYPSTSTSSSGWPGNGSFDWKTSSQSVFFPTCNCCTCRLPEIIPTSDNRLILILRLNSLCLTLCFW